MTDAACAASSDNAAKRGPGRPRHEQPSASYLSRQSEIVATAVEVFGQRGFDQGTLEDVAAGLGTGRASLYHYVESKSHLLYLIFNRAIDTTLERMDELALIESPADRIRAMIRHQIRIISADPGMFTVFFDDRPALDFKYEAEIRTKERRLLRYLIEAVQYANDAKVIDVDDPRMAAQAILGMTSWLHKWYDADRDSPDHYITVCEQLIFGTPK